MYWLLMLLTAIQNLLLMQLNNSKKNSQQLILFQDRSPQEKALRISSEAELTVLDVASEMEVSASLEL